MTAGYIQGSVGTDPIIDYTTVYTGGLVTLKLKSSTTKDWSLTRYISQGTNLVSGVALKLPTPVSPLLAGAPTQIVYIDAGDGPNGASPVIALDPTQSYVYTFTTAAGTISTPALSVACSIEVVPDDLTYLILKIIKSALSSLTIPAGFKNMPTVVHAMPLTGVPRLPIVTINQSYIGQNNIPIGQANQANFQTNISTTTAQADRIYSVAVLCSTNDEREYYRDAIIGIFNSIIGPVLDSIGQDTSHNFSADSGQIVNDKQGMIPGFYYSELMLKVTGTYNVIINSQYGIIKSFDGSATVVADQFTFDF